MLSRKYSGISLLLKKPKGFNNRKKKKNDPTNAPTRQNVLPEFTRQIDNRSNLISSD